MSLAQADERLEGETPVPQLAPEPVEFKPPMGRLRSPARVALVGLLTLGVGFLWYYFKAFREVDEDAGRPHSALCFLTFVPVVGPIFGLAYVAKELAGVNASRAGVGLVHGVDAWQHFVFILFGVGVAAAVAYPAWLAARAPLGEEAWIVPLVLVVWIAPLFSAPFLAPTVNGYWEARLNGAPAPVFPPPAAPSP